MSQPKRFDLFAQLVLKPGAAEIGVDRIKEVTDAAMMYEVHDKGIFVMHSDYAALDAEVERLKALLDSNLNASKKVLGQSDALRIERDALAAENERLRKAGDLLERALILRTYNEDLHPSIIGWDAAKEGRDAK